MSEDGNSSQDQKIRKRLRRILTCPRKETKKYAENDGPRHIMNAEGRKYQCRARDGAKNDEIEDPELVYKKVG
jgi:hypothetical protein